MKNIEQFYQELKNNFHKINHCKFWNEYDSSEEGYEHSSIMTKIAQEISGWDINEYGEFSRLFQIIENAFMTYDNKTTSYLATDFLVTIMEIESKSARDEIKKHMRSKTQETYREMLKFYNEK